MEYYLVIKGMLLIYTATWINLRMLTLSEKKATQKRVHIVYDSI